MMADGTHSRADEAARLEAALERIAQAKSGAKPAAVPSPPDLAARLDALIAELRIALGITRPD
jgi:hypothetical protein